MDPDAIMSRIPLSQHEIHDRDLNGLSAELTSSGMTDGPRITRLESCLAKHTAQSEGLVATTYSDAARILLLAMDIGPGDDVILPAFASALMTQVVLSTGATPIHADCHPRTLNIAPQAVEAAVTPRTRAIIATSVFGNPAGLVQMSALCGLLELPLIEDVAGGLGSTIDNRLAGGFGRATLIDLSANGVIGCGEGGAICTSDQQLDNRCRLLRSGEDIPSPRSVGGRLGYRCPMTLMQAAVIQPQLDRLDDIMEERSTVAAHYTRRLAGLNDVIVPTVDPGTTLSWPAFVIRLDESYGAEDRDEIIRGLKRHDIGVACPWMPAPTRPQMAAARNNADQRWPVAEFVSHRTIALPMFSRLTEGEIDLVTQTLELMMQRSTFRRG